MESSDEFHSASENEEKESQIPPTKVGVTKKHNSIRRKAKEQPNDTMSSSNSAGRDNTNPKEKTTRMDKKMSTKDPKKEQVENPTSKPLQVEAESQKAKDVKMLFDNNDEPTQESSSYGWSSSWGSWSNYLTSTAKKLGDEAKRVTSETVDKVYEKLDPEYEQEKERRRKSESSSPTKNIAEPQPTVTAPPATSPGLSFVGNLATGASAATESFFSGIDKTLDFASTTIGSAFMGGYKALESAHINEKISFLKSELEKSELVHHSMEVSGGVLKKMGAIGGFGIQTFGNFMAQGQNVGVDEIEKKLETKESSIFDNSKLLNLEINLKEGDGQKHALAIKDLCKDVSEKLVTLRKSSNFQESDTNIGALRGKFEINDSTIPKTSADSFHFYLDYHYDDTISSLNSIGYNNDFILKTIRLAEKKFDRSVVDHIESFVTELQNPGDRKMEDILYSNLIKVYNNAIQSLQFFVEKDMEQILRLFEAFVLHITEEKLEGLNQTREEQAARTLQLAHVTNQLFLTFLKDIQQVTQVYSRWMDTILTSYKKVSSQEDPVANKEEIQYLAQALTVQNKKAMEWVISSFQNGSEVVELLYLERLGLVKEK